MKKYLRLSIALFSSFLVSKANSKTNSINHRILNIRTNIQNKLEENSDKSGGDLLKYFGDFKNQNSVDETNSSTGLNWHNNPSWNQKWANNGFNDFFNQMPWRSWSKF
jgi:hypothetical protein